MNEINQEYAMKFNAISCCFIVVAIAAMVSAFELDVWWKTVSVVIAGAVLAINAVMAMYQPVKD